MSHRVTVIGLGPAGPGLITAEALAAIETIPARFVRTTRHPSAGAVPGAKSFDYLYEGAADLAEVYAGIVEALVAAAQTEDVLYAVPGSPLVAEHTVELLRADPRAEVVVLPAVSFTELAFQRLGVDPLAVGARVVDGHRFAIEAAGQHGPLLVGQCDSVAVLSEVKMAVGATLEVGDDVVSRGPVVSGHPTPEVSDAPGLRAAPSSRDTPQLVVLQRLGLPDELVTTVPWDELDRGIIPDHLTSVWVPRLELPVAGEMARLEELVRTLRAKCPWDRQQDHKSLTRYLLEESYEVLDAIDELPDGYEHLEEELGDVLFQVFFHSALAAEDGQFTVADVARTVHDKLVSRHPHVFGDVVADTPDQVVRNWEQIKRAEKGRAGLMDGIANLPALLLAHKVGRKAASVGFDWSDAQGALDKVAEELAELTAVIGLPGPEVSEELGDLLFAVVNVSRHVHVDPEAALREATVKFRRRFTAMESLAAGQGSELAALSPDELDALWRQIKTQGVEQH